MKAYISSSQSSSSVNKQVHRQEKGKKMSCGVGTGNMLIIKADLQIVLQLLKNTLSQ